MISSRNRRSGSWVVRQREGEEEAWYSWSLTRQALDVHDELHQAFFVNLSFENRHDIRRISLDQFVVGIQNRVPQEGLVGDDGLSVLELHGMPKDVIQGWRVPLLIRHMACDTAILIEKLLPQVRHRLFRSAAPKPLLIVVGAHDCHPAF